MMKHKCYDGEAWVDEEAGVIRGRVIGLKDVVTFQGATVEAARAAFVESVDDYLAFCEERGEKPEKPYSGNLLVRLGPELHRALSLTAERAGKSVNSLVVDKLKQDCMERIVGNHSERIVFGKKPTGIVADRPAARRAKARKPRGKREPAQ